MDISRRIFLETLAALPLAARLDAHPFFATSPPRIVVIGAGAFGGWTALHLRNAGAQVTLLDWRGPGNIMSSSGGKTRVIRSIYGPDRIYSEMVKHAFDLWAKLDATTTERLYVEMGALWMFRGDDAYMRAAVPIVEGLGFEVDKLTIPNAAKRYSPINFRGVESAWFERKAGALKAQQACVAVRDAFVKAGGTYRTAYVKPSPIANGSLSSVRLDDGSTLEADLFVFACGPWLGKLFPEVLGKAIRPTRQEIHYFGTPKPTARWEAGRLPIWIDFGDHIVYGIPDVDGQQLKVADDTRGAEVDPMTVDRAPSKEGEMQARQFLRQRFPELAQAPLVATWVCQYENSPDGNLIIDRHPEAENVWLVGGGSGHGFKLSPVVGEMTAGRMLAGKEVPKQFRLDRLRNITKPSTQFDRKKG